MDEQTKSTDVIEQVWTELGYRLRPMRDLVTVRTDPSPKMIGSLYLPHAHQEFYGGMPGTRMVLATVLSCGQDVKEVKPGDRVIFSRTNFIRHRDLQDGVRVGWIPESETAGRTIEEAPAAAPATTPATL